MGRARDIANLIGGATPDIILKTSDGAILNLQTSDTTVTASSVLGAVNFQAPDEADGTDAILIASKIEAVAEGTFGAGSNATKLSFSTASSEAASEKMSLTSGGNLNLLSDSAVLSFGADSDITLTHNADSGLKLKNTNTGDNSTITLALQTGETDIQQDDIIGQIEFQAPDEGTGTDAILVSANIKAISEGDFSSSSNATSLEFQAAKSGSVGADGGRLTLTSDANLVLKNVATADDSFPTITLQTGDTDIAQDDVLGRILFQAPDEGAGTDAITSSARIQAISEGDFSASSNVTSLEFRTAQSGVVGTASQGSKLTLTSDFQLQLKSMSTADGSSPIFELQTGETAVETNDILGSISWKAPDESGGTDAITQAAFILARAGADFTSSSNDTNLQFGTGLSGAASTRMTIDSSGDVSIEAGSLVLASGQGIDFSATSDLAGASAEKLDDYEEGTYTVTLTPSTSGSIGVNGSFDLASYTKIGRVVHVTGSIVSASPSSPVGGVNVSLPFAAVNLTDEAGDFAGSVTCTSTSSANVADVIAFGSEGDSSIGLFLGDNVNPQADLANEFSGNETLHLGITYFTS